MPAQGFVSDARLFPEENLPLIDFFECIPQPASIKRTGVHMVTLRQSEWDPSADSWTDTLTYCTNRFDAEGRVIEFIDFHLEGSGKPSVHHMEYDTLGRLRTWILNSQQEWTSVERYYYSPDGLFRIQETMDPDGILESVNNYQLIALLPDGKTDFMIQGTCPAATPMRFPCLEQEPFSTFQFRYHEGRPTMVNEWDAQAPPVDTSAPLIEQHLYQYDPEGRLFSIEFKYGGEPTGEIQTFSYDARGRIEKMEMRLMPENSLFRSVLIEYDERNLPILVRHFNPVKGNESGLETRRFYEWK